MERIRERVHSLMRQVELMHIKSCPCGQSGTSTASAAAGNQSDKYDILCKKYIFDYPHSHLYSSQDACMQTCICSGHGGVQGNQSRGKFLQSWRLCRSQVISIAIYIYILGVSPRLASALSISSSNQFSLFSLPPQLHPPNISIFFSSNSNRVPRPLIPCLVTWSNIQTHHALLSMQAVNINK